MTVEEIAAYSGEKLWTVGEYSDRLNERLRHTVQREIKFWPKRSEFVFPEEGEALLFMVLRAEQRVQHLRDKLGFEANRLNRCNAKLSQYNNRKEVTA